MRRVKNPYGDRRAPDGDFAHGWRWVRKGGRVKVAGLWYTAPKLGEIVGEYVKVSMNDYWRSEVIIERGAIGCVGFFCYAKPESEHDDE